MGRPLPPETAVAARRRGGVVCLLVVVLVAGLAGCTTTTRPHPDAGATSSVTPATTRTSTPSPDARAAPRIRDVNSLLRQRATAIRDHDQAAFLAGIDPRASPAFHQAQQRMFANLRDVPLASWSYQLDPSREADTSSLTGQLAGADQSWAPKVTLRYQLAGIDQQPTDRPMGYVFTRRGGHWYLYSDTALGADKTWRGPWDFGPCRVIHTGTGLVLYHPGSEATAQEVASQLDGDVRAVTSVWGNGWSRRVAVLIPSGHQELRALVGNEFSTDTIAAVAVSDYVNARTHVVKGQRVVLNPAGAKQLSPEALQVTLRHEITHVAARAYTVDGAPMWVLEGFADYVGYHTSGIPLAKAAPDLAAQVRAGKLPDRLPADVDFQAKSAQLDLAYQEAWTVCRYLAQRYGQPNLVRFYLAAVRYGHLDGGKLDSILQARFHINSDQLVAAWRKYLRDTLT